MVDQIIGSILVLVNYPVHFFTSCATLPPYLHIRYQEIRYDISCRWIGSNRADR